MSRHITVSRLDGIYLKPLAPIPQTVRDCGSERGWRVVVGCPIAKLFRWLDVVLKVMTTFVVTHLPRSAERTTGLGTSGQGEIQVAGSSPVVRWVAQGGGR